MRRRTWAPAMAGGIGALVVGAMTVFACTNLAALQLSQASGAPQSKVTVTGYQFAEMVHGVSGVTLHWNSPTGPVLASNLAPDAQGTVGPVEVTIPAGAVAGAYTIVAIQDDGKGGLTSGQPIRGAFQVTGPAAAAPAAANPAPSSVTTPSSGMSAGTIGLLLAAGVGGLLLLGAGTVAVTGRVRREAPITRSPRQ